MLFDINEDTHDDTSIVSAIDDTIKEFRSQTQEEIDNKIYFTIDGHELKFTDDSMGMPFTDKNNRIMVPIRKPLEMINAEVEFDAKRNKAIAKKDSLLVEVPINEDYIKVNGRIINMDTKAIIKDNRTYVPLRYVFEALNYKVEWHGETKTAVITNSNI
ncbi:copper amine oxidase-like domain-containing protein [Gottschalkia acidurici 9a]|uniref:Copper amine oxidase-like domain-containing protein n=1 Tax=Gottschalkia acidurici (strain ATCC 7906 / DSM 604 / BCRC 14475 / CIP 104303 / KCTC 5404 / NCIMB 10678 / 9a) TaxID=1128398 RepID=K0B054_GOTA9|nr:copper amine oxidase N-terminal domain-containing protein [Gottschalkia acidurici]AFS78031.1 copper amine oxidase-like domain-containing protein [Gottschalkia acidurici 9a]